MTRSGRRCEAGAGTGRPGRRADDGPLRRDGSARRHQTRPDAGHRRRPSVEAALREPLSQQRPDDPVLGEEYGGTTVFSGRQWVIDPIDGTKNFVRGVPVWATLIALLHDGVPVVGVVSAPALQRRWWAGAGRGRVRVVRAAVTRPRVGVLGRRPRVGESVVLQPVGLGDAGSARPFHRPHRHRLAGARLRRLLVLLPGRRGRRRHRRRTRGVAVGPRRRSTSWCAKRAARSPASTAPPARTAAAPWRPTGCSTKPC